MYFNFETLNHLPLCIAIVCLYAAAVVILRLADLNKHDIPFCLSDFITSKQSVPTHTGE